MSTAGRIAGALFGMLGLPLAALVAQAPVLGLTLGGGEFTDLRGARAGAISFAPSVTIFPSARTVVAMSGRGTRFGTGVWSAEGAVGFVAQVPVSPRFVAVIRGSGDLTHTSWRATYLQAEFEPGLELRLGAFTLSGSAKGGAARTASASTTPLPGLPPSSTAATRQALGPTWSASARLAETPGGELRIRYREEHLAVDGRRYVDRVGAAELRHGPFALAGSLGWRRAPLEAGRIGGVHASVDVARGIALLAAAESYLSNPLTQTDGGRALRVGVSLRSGGLRPARTPPRPAGAPEPALGVTRFAIHDSEARSVEVAGDWNRWRPTRLARAPNGIWYVDVKIDPGEYRYAFRINGTTWTVPDGVAAVDDGFGGRAAWLSVREAGPAREQPATFKEDA